MTTATQTPDQLRIAADAYRAHAEAAADNAYIQMIGALNAASPAHAQRHAAAAAEEARAARTYAGKAQEIAAQMPDSMIGLYAARDARQAADRASDYAGRAQHYAVNDAVREGAQARADLELAQATAAYIQARRHRQKIGAITPAGYAGDEAATAYAIALDREHNARARLEAARRMTETDEPDEPQQHENPDAPDIDEPQD